MQLSLELFFTILNHLLVFITIFFWIFARFLNGYLYNNLLDASGYADSVSSVGPLRNSFSTGTTIENLTDVQLLLTNFGNTATGSFTVSLYSDNATNPGSLLANLATYNDSVLTSGSAVVDTTVSGVILDPNTRYWIELSTTSNSVAGWLWTATAGNTDTISEYNFNNGGVSSNSSNNPYQMAVTAAPVPVPPAFALMSLGIAGLAALRRKSA